MSIKTAKAMLEAIIANGESVSDFLDSPDNLKSILVQILSLDEPSLAPDLDDYVDEATLDDIKELDITAGNERKWTNSAIVYLLKADTWFGWDSVESAEDSDIRSSLGKNELPIHSNFNILPIFRKGEKLNSIEFKLSSDSQSLKSVQMFMGVLINGDMKQLVNKEFEITDKIQEVDLNYTLEHDAELLIAWRTKNKSKASLGYTFNLLTE